MKKFSWHTDDKPSISTYINGAPKKRYLVVDGIDVVGRAVMHYKPNRKGGHTTITSITSCTALQSVTMYANINFCPMCGRKLTE